MMAAALVPALMANQCIRFVDVRTSPGPAAGDPPSFSFAFGGDALEVVRGFEVTPCAGARGSATWSIVADGVTQRLAGPLRITYGRVPVGYREKVPARPLEPGGCYRAAAEGVDLLAIPRGETLRILPNGRVIAGEPGGVLTSSAPFRQLNRASVGCARGYRRADTAADSAMVGAREYAVLDARVSCAWLNERWPELMSEPVATGRGVLGLLAGIAALAGLIFLADLIPGPS
jgi:hypothetical protein